MLALKFPFYMCIRLGFCGGACQEPQEPPRLSGRERWSAFETLKRLWGVIMGLSLVGHKAIAADDPRTALWHADSALRASTPAVETARLLKVNALSAMGRHAEALSESRSLTLEGNASNPEVLAVRAGTLYSAGNMQLAERVYQEVR